MTWVKFDDQYPIHRKVAALSDAAFRLHTEAIAWSSRNLTEGAIEAGDAAGISTRAKPKIIAEIVGRGLWHEPGHSCMRCAQPETGWIIHHYLEYQPSRDKVEKDRAARVARQHRWAAKRRGQDFDEIDPLIVYQRDEWLCWLCKKPVTRGAAAYDLWGPTVDHVIPTAAGGKHTYDNVRCAHYRCNAGKGARIVGVIDASITDPNNDASKEEPGAGTDVERSPTPARPEGKRAGGQGRVRNACSRCGNASASPYHRNVCMPAQLESA